MTTLNGTDVVDRNNNPSVNSRVLLRAFFINDGILTDPFDISGVTIFDASAHFNPSSILDTDQKLIDNVDGSGKIKMSFGASANDSGAALNLTSYSPNDSSSLSGIFRLNTGEYGVVLDGLQDSSGMHTINVSATDLGKEVRNTASAVGDYIDVWTVKFADGSNYQSVINNFTLKDNTFFTVTQPLLFESSVKLGKKKIVLDSKVDLKAFIEIRVQNRELDESIRNLFTRTLVTSGAFSIDKLNDSPGLNSRVAVSGFADTSGSVDVTTNNTLIFNWDTSVLPAIAAANASSFGGVKGTYEVRVKYSLLNQTLISPPLYITIY